MNGIIKSVVSIGNPNKTRHLVFIIGMEERKRAKVTYGESFIGDIRKTNQSFLKA